MSATIYTQLGKDFLERALFENEAGAPMDLTGGYTTEIKVAKFYGQTATVTIPGVIEIPETNGIAKYELDAVSMEVLGFGTFVYTRYLYDSLGNTSAVVSGSFVVVPSVL